MLINEDILAHSTRDATVDAGIASEVAEGNFKRFVERLTSALTAVAINNAELKALFATVEKEVGKLQRALATKDKEIARLSSDLASKTAIIATHEATIATKDATLASFHDAAVKLADEIASASQPDNLPKPVGHSGREEDDLAAHTGRVIVDADAGALEHGTPSTTDAKDTESRLTRTIDMVGMCACLEDQVAELDEEVDELQDQVAELHDEVDELKDQMACLQDELAALKAKEA